jgi:DNA-binding XRE family transcriptional regulator
MTHTNHLNYHRRKWALTQAQLADLIGLPARSVISVHERSLAMPSIRIALGYQIAFGTPLEVLFDGLADELEDAIIRRAASLDVKLRGRTDAKAKRQQEFLSNLVNRARNQDGL